MSDINFGNITEALNNKVDKEDLNRDYYFYKWPSSFTLSGGQSEEHSFTITPKLGRPVFIICSGDTNQATSTTTWFTLNLYKSISGTNTVLTSLISETRGEQQNTPFVLSYMDTNVLAGNTYSYKLSFTIAAGVGAANFSETQKGSPQVSAFEI